jgi:hypothetical protein
MTRTKIISKRIVHLLLVSALCLILNTAALARSDHGQGRSNHVFQANDHDRDDGFRRDRDRDVRTDRDRDRDRADRLRVFSPTNRPPGWNHGRKRGWGNCDLPPGQAKKEGCRSTFRTSHRHHRDRDNDRDDRVRR